MNKLSYYFKGKNLLRHVNNASRSNKHKAMS